MKRSAIFVIGVLAIAGLCPNILAQTVVNEDVKVTATVPAIRDGFGIAIDANAEFLLVGSPGIRSSGFTGNVYLFKRNSDGSLSLEKEIAGPTDSLDSRFGVSVVLGNDFFAIGSSNHYHRDDNPRAAVHIYERNHPVPNAWGLASIAEMPDETLSFSTANMIALSRSGDTIVAGYPSMERIAFIRRNGAGRNWEIISTIEDPNPANFDHFGYSVDIEGNRIVVGSRSDDEFGSNEGAVFYYEFDGSNWLEKQKIAPTDITLQSSFGSEVDLSGDWLAVRDTWSHVTLFRRESGQWVFSQKITVPSPGMSSVSLSGNRLLIGDTNYREGELLSTGQAILYLLSAENVWERTAFLRPTNPVERQQFGGKVLIGDREYFVGSGKRDTGNTADLPAGCAAVFAYSGGESYGDWTQRFFSPAQQGQNLHAPDAISNRFGIANLMAYAMDLNPFDPDLASVPHISSTPDGSLQFFYQRSPDAIDAKVSLLSSTDLINWNPATANPEQSFANGVFRYVFPLVDSTENILFFRFEFTGPSD